jgi:hypothetical protein
MERNTIHTKPMREMAPITTAVLVMRRLRLSSGPRESPRLR